MRIPVILAAAVSFAPPVQAQKPAAAGDTAVLLPDHPLLDPARVAPHRATWRFTPREPGAVARVPPAVTRS